MNHPITLETINTLKKGDIVFFIFYDNGYNSGEVEGKCVGLMGGGWDKHSGIPERIVELKVETVEDWMIYGYEKGRDGLYDISNHASVKMSLVFLSREPAVEEAKESFKTYHKLLDIWEKSVTTAS